ncbi:MAG: hypothetical protein MK085_01955 [Phycisphaerales bacterium]|nr:hypothetical protein [Phycisphaerales bacterium]
MRHQSLNAKFAGCAAIAALVLTSAALAGDSPPVELTGDVDGDFFQLNPTGSNVGANNYLYQVSSSGTNYEIDWTIFVNNDLSAGVLDGYQVLQSTVTFTNLGLEAMDVSLGVALTDVIMPDSATSALYGGSIAGSFGAGELGGNMTNSMDAPLWAALLDDPGSPIASLYEEFDFSANPFDSVQIPAQDFGTPIPSLLAETSNRMMVDMNFQITGLSTVALTSTFVAQVPAPGAAVALGLGILVPRRRRKA